MGKLLYGESKIEIEFDDRALVHVQIVIGVKLRRKESFFFSWRDDVSVGGGRSAIWLDSSIPIHFIYRSASVPSINQEWVDVLAASADSGTGMIYSEEPGVTTPRPLPRPHL